MSPFAETHECPNQLGGDLIITPLTFEPVTRSGSGAPTHPGKKQKPSRVSLDSQRRVARPFATSLHPVARTRSAGPVRLLHSVPPRTGHRQDGRERAREAKRPSSLTPRCSGAQHSEALCQEGQTGSGPSPPSSPPHQGLALSENTGAGACSAHKLRFRPLQKASWGFFPTRGREQVQRRGDIKPTPRVLWHLKVAPPREGPRTYDLRGGGGYSPPGSPGQEQTAIAGLWPHSQ